MNNSTTRCGLIGIGTVGLLLLAVTILALLSGCAKDSTDKVDEVNKQKIESQSAAISKDAKADAVKMAEKMVDLAGMHLTARSLSEVALQRATNPQVKTYARRVLDGNRQSENELTQLARSLNLQLPSSLSSEGQDRLADLKSTKAGTAFDLKYLDELGKVSKKSASVADDLEDDGTTEAVKAYGKKTQKSLDSQKDAIKQLSNLLN
jgi:putative membrane protein